MTNTPVVWDVIVMGINFSRTPALIFSNSGLCKENTAYLTDRLGGKEAWHPIHFSNTRLFPMNFNMATLGLKEMGKFLWEGREKKFAQLVVSV